MFPAEHKRIFKPPN